MAMIYYTVCSVILFFIGFYCLATKRNMIRLIMGLEIMINGVNLNFIAFSSFAEEGLTHPLAHFFTILSINIGICIIAVGLVIIVYAYRHYGTLDARNLRRLKY